MSIAEKFEVIADEVYEKGKKDEHDKFWDAYQDYGKRTSYNLAFGGYGFNFTNFYPKYDIKPVGNNNSALERIFYAWNVYNAPEECTGSLKQRLEECGVKFDTSEVTYFSQVFGYGNWTELPAMDMRNATAVTGLYNSCKLLVTIEKLLVSETTPMFAFTECISLENIVIEGTIGKNGLNVASCRNLTHDSLMSIVNALKDYSEDTSGTVYTVTLGSANISKLTDTELESIEAKGWEYK